MQQEREFGTTVRWVDERGFGFIRLDRNKTQQLFVHHSEIVNMQGFRVLKQGQRVSFIMVKDQNKRLPQALDVHIIEEDEGALN